jgi:hypothetical protein
MVCMQGHLEQIFHIIWRHDGLWIALYFFSNDLTIEKDI